MTSRRSSTWSPPGTSRARPGLVPLIDTLADRVEAREEPIAGRTANDRYEAFMAVVARRRQADLGRLVAIVPRLAYGDNQTALDALLYDWAHTPRIATLLDRIPISDADREDDLRTQHARPADVTLDAAARALIERLGGQLAREDESGESLLAQVFADPASDAPRAVYGDWLVARGDPRGEFIALQLARRTRAPDAAAVRREARPPRRASRHLDGRAARRGQLGALRTRLRPRGRTARIRFSRDRFRMGYGRGARRRFAPPRACE